MARNLIDLTGKKFGRLIVIRRAGISFRKGNLRKKTATWLCKCECGTEKIIGGNYLREGRSRSCGCLGKEFLGNLKRLPLGLANMRVKIGSYKRRAKIRGLKYNLTEEQFKEITQRNCYYCGAKPNNISKDAGLNGEYRYNGLDRIDSSGDYILDNVVPCCKICNTAKGILTTQEFKDWIVKIYDNLIKEKGD